MSTQNLMMLDNPLRDYAWGDRERLGQLFGLPNPEGTPQAEIWMGAHPGAPSIAVGEGEQYRLNDLITADPERVLGAAAIARFGERLPYLFKVLNAGQPLSIQLHPTKALAEEGFRREEVKGIPLDAPERNYVDANHKPELIYALTPFRALCGFRALPEICFDLARLNSRTLNTALEALQVGGDAQALKDFCQWLLELDPLHVEALLVPVLEAARKLEEPAFRQLVALHDVYPGDRGVLFAIMLNIVELAPGESLFMAPGHLHSYLGGVGLEIMASSDNVIRGGLTPKHVDCPELLRLATFEPLPTTELLVTPQSRGPETLYPTPADDFSFALLELTGAPLRCELYSAEILFCVSGNAQVSGGGSDLNLRPGESCVVFAQAGDYTLSGEGQVARAAVSAP